MSENERNGDRNLRKTRPGLIGAAVVLVLIIIINPNNILKGNNIIMSGIGEEDLSRTAGVQVPMTEASDTYFTEADGEKVPLMLNDKISFESLSRRHNLLLTIQLDNGVVHEATTELSNRLLELFLDLEPINNKDYTFDETDDVIILLYEGYNCVFLNRKTGHFKFENEEMIYEDYRYDDKIVESLFSRINLEEIDGVKKFTKPERLVVLQENAFDLDGDGVVDRVELYYDTAIKLCINDAVYTINEYVHEESLQRYIKREIKDHYWYESSFRLKHVQSKTSDKIGLILVEQVDGVNRYGSSVVLNSFEYDGETIKSINNFESPSITVLAYEAGIIELGFQGIDQSVDAVCTTEKQEELNLYLDFLKEHNEIFVGKDDWLFISNTLAYHFQDIDGDGMDELLTARNIRGGASSISDIVFTVYDLSSDKVSVVDIDILSHMRQVPNPIYDDLLEKINL